MLDGIKSKLKELGKKLTGLKVYLDIDKNEASLKELEAKMTSSGFWNNQEKAQSVIGELKSIKVTVGAYFECMEEYGHAVELVELLSKEPDPEIMGEMKELLEN